MYPKYKQFTKVGEITLLQISSMVAKVVNAGHVFDAIMGQPIDHIKIGPLHEATISG